MVEAFIRWFVAKQNNWLANGILGGLILLTVSVAVALHFITGKNTASWIVVAAFLAGLIILAGIVLGLAAYYRIALPLRRLDQKNERDK